MTGPPGRGARLPIVGLPIVGLLVVAALFVGARPGRADDDLRSTVWLREDCTSDIGRREVTLFANGTVRLRQGPPGEERMRLGELAPDVLDGYRARIAEQDLSETDRSSLTVEGAWVERCELLVAVPDAPERRFAYSRYSAPSLALSRLVRVVDELAERVEPLAGPGLPEGYRPRPGDVLLHADGTLFRIAARTTGGRALELHGVESPLVLYVGVDSLRASFERLVCRSDATGRDCLRSVPGMPGGPGAPPPGAGAGDDGAGNDDLLEAPPREPPLRRPPLREPWP